MITQEREQTRLRYLPALLVALLLSIGVITSDSFAAAPIGAPVDKAQTSLPGPAKPDVKPNAGNQPSACGPGTNYTIAPSGGAFVDGVADTGNHCDDCTTNVLMPFPVRLYKQVFSGAFVSSNGTLQFTSNNAGPGNVCLMNPIFSNTIFPHWDNLRTDPQPQCAAYGPTGCGIFTAVQGISPNRQFIIEWRTVLFAGGQPTNFEVVLYENSDRFDMVYRMVPNNGAGATSGVQKDTISGLFTQYSCNTPSLFPGLYLVANPAPCATPTNTPTPVSSLSITVLKLNDTTGRPLSGWDMILHDGPGCTGPIMQTGTTGSNGIFDFLGLAPGSYSVEETSQTGWTPLSGVCQNVTLSADLAPKDGIKNKVPDGSEPDVYPPAGDDTFGSGGQVIIEITGVGQDKVTLNGPTTIHRNNPCPGCGPGGRDTIDTEIISMNLTGNSPLFGPVTVNEAPLLAVNGRISQQTPGVDFPADSFFDIFVEINTSMGVLHNQDPIRLETVINAIPPINGIYIPPTNPTIPLYNTAGQPVGFIRHAAHVPLPDGEVIIVFRNRPDFSITVLKLNDTTGLPLPGWTMNLYSGSGCTGTVMQSGVTNANGMYDFLNLTPGNYSVGEVMQPGWTAMSGTCQNVTLSSLSPPGNSKRSLSSLSASRPMTATTGTVTVTLPPGMTSTGTPTVTFPPGMTSTPTATPTPGGVCTFPPAGPDTFNSGANVILDVTGIGRENVTLQGPTTVIRGARCPGCGPGGRDTIQTEMVQLDLTGNSSLFGPVTVQESPFQASSGQVIQQTPGTDFPADSFFDIFIEIQTPAGVLHNNDPIRMQSVVTCLPPIGGIYIPPNQPDVPLYNAGGQLVGYIRHAAHAPIPDHEVFITFRNRPPELSITVLKLNDTTGRPLPGWNMILHDGPGCVGPVLQTGTTGSNGIYDFLGLAPGNYSVEETSQTGWTPMSGVCQNVSLSAVLAPKDGIKNKVPDGSEPDVYPPAGDDSFGSGGQVIIDITGVGQDKVTLNGPTTAHRENPCVGCGPGGRTTIDTEIVAMDLTGSSSLFGPVMVRESPSRASTGRISQQVPGVDFPADSFFDIFVEIQSSMGVLHNNDPIRLDTVINAIPPINGIYIPPTNPTIPLYNTAEQAVGFIRHAAHIPLPDGEIIIVFRNRPDFSITVLKLNDTTGLPLPGWTMNLYSGSGCTGTVMQSGVTNANGMYDFVNLKPGNYSVAEVLQPGWTAMSGTCQNVTVGSLSPRSTNTTKFKPASSLGASRPMTATTGTVTVTLPPGTPTSTPTPGGCTFPPAGPDSFNSGANVILDITGIGRDNVTLQGPTTVMRGPRCPGCGPGGRDTIQTEMVQLDLTGNSSLFGPVVVRESPSQASAGQVIQQTPGTDFPADSFFDIFIEIDTPAGVLHNNNPIHMQSVITCLPPIGGIYIPPNQPDVALYNTAGQLVGYIRHAAHAPIPDHEVFITFRNRPDFSVTVLKLNDVTGRPLPGWTMNLHQGVACVGPVVQTGVTGSNGIYDFLNLKPGPYSVAEVLQPGWTPLSGVCQNVSVGSLSPTGVGKLTSSAAPPVKIGPPFSPDVYPPAGDDSFGSGGNVIIEITGVGQSYVNLNGPTTVHRNNPCTGCGPGGRDTIDTEIIAMDLTGSSPLFGPVMVRESPTRASAGRISQQVPGTDFPADSFFDVFVELDTSMGVLHNQDPIHLETVINAIPPINGIYIPPTNPTIPLYNTAGQIVGYIRHAAHVPLPNHEVIVVFRNRPDLSITVLKLDDVTNNPLPGWTMTLHSGPNCTGPVLGSQTTGADGTTDFINLPPGSYSVEETVQSGWVPVGGACQNVTLTAMSQPVGPKSKPTDKREPQAYPPAGSDSFESIANVIIEITGVGTHNVTLSGPATAQRANPCMGCGPGGRDYIDTEMVAMDLTGVSPFGPIMLRESPTRASTGRISQQNPGIDFPADSFFDIFVEIQTSMGVLHTEDPIRMQSVIYWIPPLGGVYIPPTNPTIPLYNSAGQVVGFLRHARHIPGEILIIFRNRQNTPTPTNTPVPPTFTNTPTFTPTNTPTNTPVPPTFTNTSTRTPIPPTFTFTPVPPTFTNTPTNTPVPPTLTRTPILPTHTNTPIPPTLTRTPILPTHTNTPTATPTCKPILIGHLIYQGMPQPDPRNLQKSITLTLKLGNMELNYPLMVTDDRGFFTVNVSTLPPGAYQWRVKGAKYLANSGTLVLTGACITNFEVGTLRAGDSNNDNLVNSVDFTLLKNSFGKACGDPGFDARADFNNDCIVNSTDFTLLRNNFGMGGAPPINPGGR